MDIKIKMEDYNFKYRVSGIILKDNKILIVKMCDNTFYCLPGGHVKMGESTIESVKREIKEETGYNIVEPKLIAITENFFSSKFNKNMHELGAYYILSLDKGEKIEKESYTIIENDNGEDIKLEFKWIDIEKLNEINFQPIFLKEKLINRDYSLTHHIIK